MWKSKNKGCVFKAFMTILTVFSIMVIGGISYMNTVLPKEFNVISGENLTLDSKIPIKAVYSGESQIESKISNNKNENYSVKLKAFGIFPIKQASVNVVSKTDVYVLGNPFGIKIYTDGVMIVGLDSVTTENGKVSPGADAGLKEGDLIISINGTKVYSNEDVAGIIEASKGKELTLKIISDEKEKTVKVTPALCYQSGKYKTGIWVRDSSAGIGTLTFYSPALKTVCGLGHGICDVDTGKLLTINSGELVKAEILDVDKGSAGAPGELVGRFKEECFSNLKINNDTGVYGNCDLEFEKNSLTQIAFKQEISVGDAEILTTIDGTTPKLYKCKIEKIAHNNSVTKNMVVKITDDELLQKTGGIVQGM
ncbi:MAG: SpoIVB peptidase [Ruminococcaceae bacterium]|nr:SpoIVB peptidase [Oscillospiraceae bacterium]